MHLPVLRRLAAYFSASWLFGSALATPVPSAENAVLELEARGAIRAKVNGQTRVLELARGEVAVARGGAAEVRLPGGARIAGGDALRQWVQLAPGGRLSQVLAAPAVQASGSGGGRRLTAELAAPVFYERGREGQPAARFVATEELLLVGVDRAMAAARAEATGALSVRTAVNDTLWVLRYASAYVMLAAAQRLEQAGVAVEPQLARQRVPKAAPNDPLYPQQFYFRNTGQARGTPGVDINIESLWPAASGSGVTVAVVDDGLELTHPDLNIAADPSWHANVLGGGNDPTPAPDDNHGTVCAGFIAARANNGIGLAGAAPLARLVGVKILGAAATDAQEAAAFGWRTDIVSISSNSWGPDDDAKTVSAPDTLALAALRAGVTAGRGGRGVIYVVAAGNGRDSGDYAGYDGYSGNRHVIAVGATDNTGRQASFSESGPQVLIVAAGQTREDSDEQLVATDNVGERGKNKAASPGGDYTTSETQGTSYSAPQISGIAALMLEANPRLGWRDVKEILIRTARRTDAADADWVTNGGGFRFNHKYGAGFADAAAAVALARTWSNLAPETSRRQSSTTAENIPDNEAAGAARRVTFAATDNLRVETVEVTVSVSHANRGQLRFELVSPAGTRTVLGLPRTADTGADLENFTFSTPRHWGEMAAGEWTVRVIDTVAGTAGRLTAAAVTLYGAPAAAVSGPVIVAQPASLTVAAGGAATFSVGASGAGLAYQWRKDGAEIAGATGAALTLPSVTVRDAGTYDVIVLAGGGRTTSAGAVLTVTGAGPSARLGNLSVRTSLAAGQALTVGFVVQGGPKSVLVRAVGPTLGEFGVAGVHPDPTIELFQGATRIDQNDNWAAALAPVFGAVGAFPLTANSRDAALQRTLEGPHTARIAGSGSGVLLLEAYDAGSGNTPRIVNVSARNFVGTGDEILIAGFVVTGTGQKRVMIRAVGPTLRAFGLDGVLNDPALEIVGSDGRRVAQNDDWEAGIAAAFSQAGAFPLEAGSLDAAIVVALAPGSYTVQVRGIDGGTGEALIEVYDLDN